MDWLKRLNEAMEYIEKNLEGKPDPEQTAKIACCSVFHFQRMFSYMADMPLSEYVRRRKMTKAAFDLQNGEKVLDVALKYGYDSPTAFTRAFKAVHGVPPSAAREEGVSLKSYPPICFLITIKGDVQMDYKIIHKDAFKIVGHKRHYAGSVEECFQQVPLFWGEAHANGWIPPLCPLMDGEPMGVLGVSACQKPHDFDYFIAVATNKDTPEGLSEYVVPACTWAVFESVGPMPGAIQALQKRIVTEWLPNSGYEYADAPDIEVYGPGDQSAADYRCEVWLPVVKKG